MKKVDVKEPRSDWVSDLSCGLKRLSPCEFTRALLQFLHTYLNPSSGNKNKKEKKNKRLQ